MKSVLKPKLFNDESFDVKSRRDHELDSEREGELKASMKRSEAGAAFLRYIALAIVAGLLIKGLMPLNFSKYAVYVLNFKNVLDFLLGLAGEIYSNFIADKIYFSTLFLLMWLFYANYGLFRFFFIRNHMSLYNKGVALMDNKNYPAAVVSFESALKNFMPPLDMIKIRSELARCYLALANYDLCIYNCNKVLEADGGNDAAAETIARAYLENDDRGETAVKFYIGLFNQGFSDSRMVKILCSHFMSSNDISDTALTVYKKAMEHSPDDALLRNMLFKACVISNDRSGYALELYEKIFSDEPDRTDVMLALVTAYYNAKNYKKCALMCRQLFDRREFSQSLFDYYAESMQKLNQKQSVYGDFLRLMEKNPKNEVLKKYFESMKPLFMAERIVASANAATGAGHESQAARPAINICADCAHMNPIGIGNCEKCGSPLSK